MSEPTYAGRTYELAVDNGVVFLVGWVETSGMTVTHAMNLDTATVHAFWTYDTPDGRVAELHTAHLKEL